MCCSPEARARKQARRQARKAAFAHLVQGFIGSNSRQAQQQALPPQQKANSLQPYPQYPQYPQYGTMRGVTEAPPQYGIAGPMGSALMAPAMDEIANAPSRGLPTYGQVMGDEKVEMKEK